MSAKNEKTKSANVWSDDEKTAMKARAQEMKAEERMSKNKAEGEKVLLAAIAKMPEPDRSLAKQIHEIVQVTAPNLMPKTWYGMPAYANADGKVVCFFQAASKFGTRYSTLGFTDLAKLDDGNMWAASFAMKELTDAEEKKIRALVKKAVS
jgi:uncharacterized protein YdhG (YjbR/CyaY superfamily)